MITATLVKELREKTGVGMMECKKALTETNGDMEKAIVWLRERGLSRAAKKADRVAAEGLVEVMISPDGTAGILLELNCETDFVSRNPDFTAFAHSLAELALRDNVTDVEKLSAMKYPKTGNTVDAQLTSLVTTIGENMKLRRIGILRCPGGVVAGYSHMGGKIGTLVGIEGGKGANVAEVAKDLSMHVAAASPKYLNSTQVDVSELEQEKEIARKKLREEKKPDALIEKILEGQMKKFYKEVCLIEQAFVKDPDTIVGKLVEKTGPGLKLAGFLRFALGEGIEKKSENFADEVAAQLRQ